MRPPAHLDGGGAVQPHRRESRFDRPVIGVERHRRGSGRLGGVGLGGAGGGIGKGGGRGGIGRLGELQGQVKLDLGPAAGAAAPQVDGDGIGLGGAEVAQRKASQQLRAWMIAHWWSPRRVPPPGAPS